MYHLNSEKCKIKKKFCITSNKYIIRMLRSIQMRLCISTYTDKSMRHTLSFKKVLNQSLIFSYHSNLEKYNVPYIYNPL